MRFAQLASRHLPVVNQATTALMGVGHAAAGQQRQSCSNAEDTSFLSSIDVEIYCKPGLTLLEAP